MFLKGLTEFQVQNTIECFALLKRSLKQLNLREKEMDPLLRRFSYIFQLNVECRNSEDQTLTTSTLKFIDLLQNNKVLPVLQGTNKKRLIQHSKLSLSLLTLKQVVSALLQPQSNQRYVPYRESKLTKYLQDYIGGNSQVDFLFCITQNMDSIDNTIDSLRFSDKVKNVNQDPKVNKVALKPKKEKSPRVHTSEKNYLKEILKIKNNKGLQS